MTGPPLQRKMGSKQAFAAVWMNDRFSPTPKVVPRTAGSGSRAVRLGPQAVGGDCMSIDHCKKTLRRNSILESIRFLFCKSGCWFVSFRYSHAGNLKVKAQLMFYFLFT